MSSTRRLFMKLLGGTAAGTAIAGCLGNNSASQEDDTPTAEPTEEPESEGTEEPSDSSAWPPDRGLVDMITPSSPGSSRDVQARIWTQVAQDYYPGDIRTTVTSTPGAEGLLGINETYNANPNGGTIGSFYYLTALIAELTNPDVEFKVAEFRPFYQMWSSTRGIQVNPITTGVEGHFEWSWDDFVEYANENGLRLGWTSVFHVIVAGLLMEWDDNLEDGAIEMIPHNSGSEARTAFARGDLDVYMGTFNSNYPARNDYYYTQFVLADQENYPKMTEAVQNTESGDGTFEQVPDRALLPNTSFPTENARRIVDIVISSFCAYLPPGTSDEIFDIHESAWEEAENDERTKAQVTEAFDELAFQPMHGEELQRALQAKYKLFTEDEEVNALVMEYFG